MWQTIHNISLRVVLAVITLTEAMFKSSTCIIVVNTDTHVQHVYMFYTV